jgi:hypothetical protein
VTDKRKNNGGHASCGRKRLGERKSETFRLPIHCSEWLDKKVNKNAAVVALIEKAINEA